MASRAVQITQTVIAVGLAGLLALALVTAIAINKSRSRTECLRSAESVEQCPVPSGWENVLYRVIGP